MKHTKRMVAVMAIILAILSLPAVAAKNVIVMISDGQGFNTIQATDYYTGSLAAYENFDIKFGMQTNSANNPAGYNPASMAANFGYSTSGATDSASAGTAMYTGVKNYDGQINWSTTSQPLTTFFEKAAMAGKSIGAVSSVEFTHATPAAVFGHNSNRNNYSEMALEAVYGSNPNSHNAGYDAANYNGNLKVVMGTGHPNYNANGQPQSSSYGYVGGSQAWTDLGNGANGWTRVETKAGFEALTTGDTPDKVFGVAENISTLQQGRSNPAGNFDPMLTNVPTLETMTKASLNILDNGSNGFAVMIEGGAIDWANHANQFDRMIEEQIDFNKSVQAAIDWVNINSSWEETLLIVTADHETGHLWGDGSKGFFDVNGDGIFTSGVDYGYVADNGAGVLPGGQYFSGNHTNALVPFFAKGANADLFANYIVGTDQNLRGMYNLDNAWTGEYIDNTAVYNVAMTIVPEPATLVLLGIGSLLFVCRKK